MKKIHDASILLSINSSLTLPMIRQDAVLLWTLTHFMPVGDLRHIRSMLDFKTAYNIVASIVHSKLG